jgi:hypothetical protein
MNLPITNTAFWDVDFNELDQELHADFIITRVFQFGLLNDLKKIVRHYSVHEINNAFKSQRGIDNRTIDLARLLGYLNE